MSDRREEEFDYGLAPGEAFEPEFDDEPFDPAVPHVMTVLGPIEPGALGFTLHHEHVFNFINPLAATDPDQILDDPARSVADLEIYFAAGGRSIVDMGPADYGRSIEEHLWIARRAPVNVILVTGHHKDLIAAPFLEDDSIETIAERNIREIVEGIDGTSVRAGLIKAGTSLDEITRVERRVLEAAAIAQQRTGASISTHTEKGTMAIEQIEVMAAAGADPSRIVLCHLDFRLGEVDYLTSVLATGAYVSFDQFGKTKYAPDEDRAAVLFELADAGFLDQLLVSGDNARQSGHTGYGGGPGFEYFPDRVMLTLMDAGFDAPSVRRIFVDNPARFLTIKRPN
ncbi:MAG: phosphotriesterase-related protein [Chloroflexota bacterium]|nr:phosphotriesterase-related protein [Chloroflexota bacterium]